MTGAELILEAIDDALPLIQDLFVMWLSQGKDPKVELKTMLDAVELVAIQAEKLKFQGK